jgi:PPK2 family polyphosphate:nucleotide phosphotransferase
MQLTQKELYSFIKRYRVSSGKDFSLSDFDPGDTGGIESDQKDRAKDMLSSGIQLLAELQSKLYAADGYSLLLIFQAMDAAGKDSTIKHVMSGINPQGCQVYSFKEPTSADLNHDYMWRYLRCLPERGRIGIFNRSYYEEVLIVRVHEEILRQQRIPKELITKNIWNERLEDIRDSERYFARNGIITLKFFLNVSKKEQKKRFMERLDQPNKNWKMSPSDVKERGYWSQYMRAYQDAISKTATKDAPWYIVPADNKWFTRLVVASAVVHTLHDLNLTYPKVSAAGQKELEEARCLLLSEK